MSTSAARARAARRSRSTGCSSRRSCGSPQDWSSRTSWRAGRAGRKVIAPGVAGHETIRTFHSARFMEDPLAVQCNLVGNPLHEEQLEIVRMLGGAHALNTVLDEDTRSRLRDVRRDHRQPSGRCRFRRGLRRGCRSGGGSRRWSRLPQAIRSIKLYYQTIKGMVTPLDILEPGGTLIIRVGVLGRVRVGGVSRRAAPVGRSRLRAVPRDAHGEVARRGRRMADRNAVEGATARQRRALYDRAHRTTSAR